MGRTCGCAVLTCSSTIYVLLLWLCRGLDEIPLCLDNEIDAAVAEYKSQLQSKDYPFALINHFDSLNVDHSSVIPPVNRLGPRRTTTTVTVLLIAEQQGYKVNFHRSIVARYDFVATKSAV